MIARLSIHIFAIVSMLPALVRAAETHESDLPVSERAKLETIACRDPHQVALDRVSTRFYGKGLQAPAAAEVHCASHAAPDGMQVHYVVQCSRSEGAWGCQGEWIEFPVQIESKQVATRVEEAIKPAQAAAIVRKIAGYGRFQGYVLKDALAAPCYVTQTKAREFIDVKCEGWHMIVSTWCPQEPKECPRLLSIDKQI